MADIAAKKITYTLSIIAFTLVTIVMGYHVIQPHTLSIPASQILLIGASIIALWFVIPRIIQANQIGERLSYIGLFTLIHLAYIHMNPVFIRVIALFMFITSVCLFILTVFPIRVKPSNS